jgi:hypothetical protein
LKLEIAAIADSCLVYSSKHYYSERMPKRSSKKKRDLNQLAADIVAQSTDEDYSIDHFTTSFKNPAAVELGRLGGLKGGKARAEKLSKGRRQEIARQAAKKRWSKRH